MKRMQVTLAVALSACFGLSAMAQDPAPSSVRDLIGARASSGESELQSRGYRHVKTEKGDDRIWSNWWNSSSHTCLSVVTMDGRYDSIVTAPAFDCDQEEGGSSSHGRKWVEDLIGARASSLDYVMEQHNFEMVDNFKGTEEIRSWWHNRGNDACLMVQIIDGRIADIMPTPNYAACKAKG